MNLFAYLASIGQTDKRLSVQMEFDTKCAAVCIRNWAHNRSYYLCYV